MDRGKAGEIFADSVTDANRAAYRKAFLDHHAASARLQQLEEAALRASDECRAAYTARDDAEQALRAVQQRNPAELVDAFLANQPIDHLRLKEAEAKVRHAEAEFQRYQELEKALQAEITRAQSDLRMRAASLHAALAAVICASPQFQQLRADLKAAWFRLRSLRETFAKVQTACAGHMPNDVMGAMASEPLEERVGFPIDGALVSAWETALTNLLTDPDAELPQ